MASSFRFNCPRCGQIVEADSSAAGEILDCPNCQELIEIPEPSTSKIRAVRESNEGRPPQPSGGSQSRRHPVQTIEKTSKKLKGQRVAAFLLGLLCIVALAVVGAVAGGESPPWAVVPLLCGLLFAILWEVVIRFLTWWHHG